MDKLRIAVIGFGSIGEKHVASMMSGETPRLELAAVCIRSPERQAIFRKAYPGVPVFTDTEELYRNGCFEAVLLATPHYNHPGQAIEAFSHGFHVLTEKPSGVYTKQVREMNTAAARSGKVFGIMYNQRADPLYRKLREMIRSGELGQLKRVNWTVTHWYRSQAYHDSSPWHSTWSGEGGGVLINQSIHQLDLWQWIFGMPDRVWARAGFGKYHAIQVEDDVTAYFEYDSGLTGTFITSTGETPGTNRLEIACDMGKVVLEDGCLRFWRNEVSERIFERENTEPFGKPACWEVEIPVDACGISGYTAILNNFASAALDGTELLTKGEDGIRAVTIANSILLSAWTGETVETRDFPDERYLALLQKAERR